MCWLFLKIAGLTQVTDPTVGHTRLAKPGKQASRTPEERVELKVTQDVALQEGVLTETAGSQCGHQGDQVWEGEDHALQLPDLPVLGQQKLSEAPRAADSQARALAVPPQATALVPVAFLSFREDNLFCPEGVFECV